MQNQIPKNWQKVRLGEVVDIRRGASPRPIHEYISNSGMPWLKIADITSIESRYVDSTKEFIREAGISKSVTVKPGDLILSNSATPGIPRFMRITACVHDGWLILNPAHNLVDKDYLFYRLIVDRRKLVSNVTGAVFDNLKTDILKDHEVPLPFIDEQKQIAHILSSFDDKIEVNNKIAKTLEEMAQAIFKEWFIKFRFPGYEKTKFVDSEFGKIPTEWRTGDLSEIVDLTKRSISPYKFRGERFLHYSIPAYDTLGLPIIETGENILSNKFLMPKDCILISKLNPTTPRIWLPKFEVNLKSIASTEFLVLTSKENVTKEYVYSFCTSKIFQNIFQNRTTGTSTSHQRVRPNDLLNIQLAIPPKNKILEYSALSKPMYMSIQKLKIENQKLAEIRDLLLPKLMRGEIRV